MYNVLSADKVFLVFALLFFHFLNFTNFTGILHNKGKVLATPNQKQNKANPEMPTFKKKEKTKLNA